MTERKRYVRLDEDDQDEIWEYMNRGDREDYPAKDIAEAFGVSLGTVYRIANRPTESRLSRAEDDDGE